MLENSNVIELPVEENENVQSDTSVGGCNEQVLSTTIEESKEEVVDKKRTKRRTKRRNTAEIPVRKVVKQ